MSMSPPPAPGLELIREIDQARPMRPCLWWLGYCGFVIKYYDIIFYLDPAFTESTPQPSEIRHADMVLCTHTHQGHMHPTAIPALLQASPRAKVILPKSAAAHARSIGVSLDRMTTTDSGLRVEYFKGGVYARVYAVPSAHPHLDNTPLGGYPYLGYLVRCGDVTVYHAGDCVPYEGLASSLRPYNVTVAILPVHGPNFTVGQAARLTSEIGARWLVPMHYFENDSEVADHFVNHMLFECPSQRFKVFHHGEGWEVPEPGLE